MPPASMIRSLKQRAEESDSFEELIAKETREAWVAQRAASEHQELRLAVFLFQPEVGVSMAIPWKPVCLCTR